MSILVLSFFSAKSAEKAYGNTQDKQDKATNIEYTTQYRLQNAAKVFGIGMIFNTLWVLIVLFSKNLIFDSILYDSLVTIFYTGALIFTGVGVALTLTNYVGLSLIIIGLILMRL